MLLQYYLCKNKTSRIHVFTVLPKTSGTCTIGAKLSVTVNENTNTNLNILLMWFLPSLNIKEALPVVELAISNWKKKIQTKQNSSEGY